MRGFIIGAMVTSANVALAANVPTTIRNPVGAGASYECLIAAGAADRPWAPVDRVRLEVCEAERAATRAR